MKKYFLVLMCFILVLPFYSCSKKPKEEKKVTIEEMILTPDKNIEPIGKKEPGPPPLTPPAPPLKEEIIEKGGDFSIQILAARNLTQVNRVIDELKIKEYNVFVESVEIRRKTWHRIYVGRFPSRKDEDALIILEKLKDDGYRRAFIKKR
jgi:cell division septation protein DedD